MLRHCYKWNAQFTELNGFEEDGRGCYDRALLLDKEDLLQRFRIWLKTSKRVTIDLAQKYLSEVLLSHLTPEHRNLLVSKFGFSLPISP